MRRHKQKKKRGLWSMFSTGPLEEPTDQSIDDCVIVDAPYAGPGPPVLSQRPRRMATAFTVSRELLGFRQTNRLSQLLYARHSSRLAPLQQWAFSHAPVHLHENLLGSLNQGNKIFCSCWLDNSTVMAGSKDGHISVWDIVTGDRKTLTLPPAGSASLPDSQELSGPHFITLSHCQRYVLSGTFNPCHIALFDCDTLRPRKLFLNAHSDWIFDTVFVNQHQFVSGGRGGTIAFWDVRDVNGTTEGTHLPFALCRTSRSAHSSRCRCLQMAQPNRLLSCSPETSLKAWDVARLEVVQAYNIQQLSEVVSMAVHSDNNMVALGHSQGVAIISLEPSSVIIELSSVRNSRPEVDLSSVRSLSWHGDILTIGTGTGVLAFYNVRADRFLALHQPELDQLPGGRLAAEAASGAAAAGIEPEPDRSRTAQVAQQSILNGRVAQIATGRFAAASALNTQAPAQVDPHSPGLVPGNGQSLPATPTTSARYPVVSPLSTRSVPSKVAYYRQIRNGFILHDEIYRDVFYGEHLDIAIYTHCWNPSITSLFVGGGPLASGLVGCYAAVWRP